MAINKITDAARDAASVGALADRPNSTATDGYSGLTPTQLKAKFDALPFLNTAKINQIIDLINGTDLSSLAYLLSTPVEYEGVAMTLYEFLDAIQDGTFGNIAKISELTLAEAISAANKLPSGGTAGQVLKKRSGTDYDVEWDDESGGGTLDYDNLNNKPKINSVTLSGNKSLADIGAEAVGKITIGGVAHSVTRKALAITDGNTTTTYYVADIT